jgi:hypothetical protein
MSLYSFQGAPPAPLPFRIRLPNGFTRTNPSSYTTDELEQWGYTGPIALPPYNAASETVEWHQDQASYVVRALTAEEVGERLRSEARRRVNYHGFYDALLVSNAYRAIREQATVSLSLTVACTEFVAAITDAKIGRPNEPAIQACINNILGAAAFNAEEIDNLLALMTEFSLDGLYSLPGG